MSKITIPPEAVEKTAREIAPHPWSMYTDAAKDHFRHKAIAAIRAALAAWPGMAVNDGCPVWHAYPHITLPLPQEKIDE